MGVRSGKGDKGFTDLSFHKRISKDSVDMDAIGDLDELDSYLGLVKSKMKSRKDKAVLEKIQHAIYTIISEIVIGAEKNKKLGPLLKKEDAEWIKGIVYQLEQKVKIESCFYLPGDGELSAVLDVTRTVARRAERSVVGLFQKEKIRNAHVLTYLNCVSDVLFIMAREKAGRKGKVRKKAGRKGMAARKKRKKSAR